MLRVFNRSPSSATGPAVSTHEDRTGNERQIRCPAKCPTRGFGRGIEQLSQCFVPTFGRDTASYLVSNWVFCLILPSTSMGGPGMAREAQGWPGMHREAQGRPGRLREAQRGPRLPMEAHGGPGWQGGDPGRLRDAQGDPGSPGLSREAQGGPGMSRMTEGSPGRHWEPHGRPGRLGDAQPRFLTDRLRNEGVEV